VNATLALIAQNPLFSDLPEDTQKLMAEYAIQRSYEPGETMVYQEDVWPYLFLVGEGEVNAIKESPDGRVLIVTTFRPGEIFWGLAFFVDDTQMPMTLQANSPVVIHLWPREVLTPIILENGDMSWRLCQMMIERMQLASGIVEGLAFQPVIGRLSNLLLEYFGDAEDQFKTRILTLDDMAARIGTSREMVCRSLHRFVENGAIEMSRTELRIKDRTILERQAWK
jgi:CRP-like cAMP-binding protein